MLFKNKPFVENNLSLQRISAKCIATYSESRSFALAEIERKDKHIFSKTAREILLLKYRTWFSWLVEVEDVLRRNPNHKDVASIIMKVSDDLEKSYTLTLKEETKTFNPKFVNVWLETHKFMYNYLRKKILDLSVHDLNKFMIDITTTLIQVMDNTLFELHEIDSLFEGNDMFISFDDICVDYRKVVNVDSCLLAERLKVYNKQFYSIKKNLIIKDYSTNKTMTNDRSVSEITFKAIGKLGYRVTKIE